MKKVLVLTLFGFMGFSAFCQTSATKSQALFIYNFIRYVEWPSNSSSGDFVIGVLGNGSIISDLSDITSGKLSGSKKIVVKQLNNVDEVTNCQLVFVNRSFTNQFAEILAKLQGKSTLVVTDKPGMIDKGAGINFVIEDGKQRFEVNRNTIERSKLIVNSKLLEMAVASN
jgi:hypothetical protein